MNISTSCKETKSASVVDACTRAIIRRRLLPGVCSYRISRNASVSVDRRDLLVAFRNLPFIFEYGRQVNILGATKIESQYKKCLHVIANIFRKFKLNNAILASSGRLKYISGIEL